MKLCYGRTSSFSRKVRAAIIECGLADRITEVQFGTIEHDPELAALNPLVKVPALVTDEGEVLYDSPVICEYLDSLLPTPKLIPAKAPTRWRALRRQALGDGLMEALIFLGVPVRRPDGEATAPALLERQRSKIDMGLDVLEKEAGDMEREGPNVGCIAVGCALGWLEYRFPDWDWRKSRPALATWYEKFSRRPAMTETAPKGR